MLFAIVDIETAGGSAADGGITEIAVVIHDGSQVLDRFESLINPETSIPSYITGLTGIDESMVANAPKFEEIAERLFNLLDNKIFVAHQVNFDYNFIRLAFERCGMDFDQKKLCTVRLSRRILPGRRSYSLGRLCEQEGIHISARHRAMGDAYATAVLFGKLYELSPDVIHEFLGYKSQHKFLPPNFPKTKYDEIPRACGVYYMLNENRKVIYVGKAINIQERFKSHFSGKTLPQLKENLKTEVVDLEWKITGNEFFALLLESLEIKRLWPKFNSAMKRPTRFWGLFQFEDGNGFKRFQVAPVKKGILPLETFFAREEAIEFIKGAISRYDLCERRCGLRKVNCSDSDLASCSGVCSGIQSPKEYNSRVEDMLSQLSESKGAISITLDNTDQNQRIQCVFEDGLLSKYVVFSSEGDADEDSLDWIVVPKLPETFYILRRFINTLPTEKIKVLAT